MTEYEYERLAHFARVCAMAACREAARRRMAGKKSHPSNIETGLVYSQIMALLAKYSPGHVDQCGDMKAMWLEMMNA